MNESDHWREHMTGQVRFRTGLTGSLILQVQVETKEWHPDGQKVVPVEYWRDARASDITRQKLPGAKP